MKSRNGALSVLLLAFFSIFAVGFSAHIDAAQTAKPCADSLNECPETGCATEGTPNALSNSLKRTIISVDDAKTITFITMQLLQKKADDVVGQNHFLTADDRASIQQLDLNGMAIGEGTAVRLAGYIVGKTHANGGESVNCLLKGAKNNDFHITIAETAEQDGDDSMAGDTGTVDLAYQGVVVEMIPQHRLKSWTIKNLEQIRLQKKKVLVVGQLFYDSIIR